ncbi:SRPBCC family protein [Nonomuraea sp. NPDC004297]
MDMVTGAQVTVALPVPIPRERMWELITAVDRIGEWSPEATGGDWCDGAQGPAPGSRFTGRNRYPNGFENTVTCVVAEAERPGRFAWTVLDDAGLLGSTWRYELHEGDEPGSTLVYHSFTHGPGASGAREGAEADPQGFNSRLVTLCRNMTTTIAAMATGDSMTGEAR